MTVKRMILKIKVKKEEHQLKKVKLHKKMKRRKVMIRERRTIKNNRKEKI